MAFLPAMVVAAGGCGGDDDAGCSDGEMRACTCPGGATGTETCAGGVFGECSDCPEGPPDAAPPDAAPADGAPDAVPAGDEVCDGHDNDGDGATDEWDPDTNPSCMVEIAAGDFSAGCPASAGDCAADATPAHTVTLSAYSIDATEVTQAAYQACMDAGNCMAPTGPPGDFDPVGLADHPVNWVNWQRALLYCSWAGKRLPTEAEWERATRGTDDRRYPWGEDDPSCDLATYSDCAATAAAVVGARTGGASPSGAFDMAGNVAEWVIDFYDATYYTTNTDWTDPSGPMAGTMRVRRGGGFQDGAAALATWARSGITPGTAGAALGFRCAQTM